MSNNMETELLQESLHLQPDSLANDNIDVPGNTGVHHGINNSGANGQSPPGHNFALPSSGYGSSLAQVTTSVLVFGTDEPRLGVSMDYYKTENGLPVRKPSDDDYTTTHQHGINNGGANGQSPPGHNFPLPSSGYGSSIVQVIPPVLVFGTDEPRLCVGMDYNKTENGLPVRQPSDDDYTTIHQHGINNGSANGQSPPGHNFPLPSSGYGSSIVQVIPPVLVFGTDEPRLCVGIDYNKTANGLPVRQPCNDDYTPTHQLYISGSH